MIWQRDPEPETSHAMCTRATQRLHAGRTDKMLVLSDGGLGDAIHLLPALWLLRRNFPDAKLHVAIGFEDFYRQLTPWIDGVLPKFERKLLANWPTIRTLRRERLDAALSVAWRKRPTFVAGLCGARVRMSRSAPEDESHWWHPLLLTGRFRFPLYRHPMYVQQWQCIRQLGLTATEPEFVYRIDPAWLTAVGIAQADRGSYVHYAPFTSSKRRDLPLAQHVELLRALHRRHERIVLSCDPQPASIALLEAICSELDFAPWRVFAGNLRLHQFAAVIDGARLHVGGDTGGLHLARLVETPSASWFRKAPGNRHWLPAQAEVRHRALISDDARIDALHGIDTPSLIALTDEVIRLNPCAATRRP